MYYVLLNEKAANNNSKSKLGELYELIGGEKNTELDITKINDFKAFFDGLTADDKVVISGGDGTLCHFVNDVKDVEIKNPLYYFPSGTGNDFYNDVKEKYDTKLIPLKEYIKDLPEVTINGKTSLFINGIGYGIDGYCCEEGDRLKALSNKPVNYTIIAIRGLLYKFKPVNGSVTVDGVKHDYKKVWLIPTMNGRFYGGGMMATPGQDRLNADRHVSAMAYAGYGPLRTLMVFPGIFKGKHAEHKDMVHIFEGHDIKVEFDRPCALQIDGETVLNVTSYEVHTKRK